MFNTYKDYETYKQGKYIIGIFKSGTKFWTMNGVYHREDGPAWEYASGFKEWYLYGKQYKVNSVEELLIASIIE